MARDVAAAYEMLTLLSEKAAERNGPLDAGGMLQSCREGIYCRRDDRTVVLAIDIPVGSLSYIACWCVESLMSEEVRQRAGLLLIPFVLETDSSGNLSLFPEWWTLFCPDKQMSNGIPILALKSVLTKDGFEDWVEVAKQRRSLFGIPD